MEAEKAESSTPQSSLVSSVVVVDNKKMERPAEASKTRYSERVKELDLEDLTGVGGGLGAQGCVTRGLESTPLCRLKAREAHFSRAKMMESADLTGMPLDSVMGRINYRPLKQLGSPGLIAQIRVATPAQLRVVEKLLEPGNMGLPDAAYKGSKLANDPRYDKPVGTRSWQKYRQYMIDQTRERQE